MSKQTEKQILLEKIGSTINKLLLEVSTDGVSLSLIAMAVNREIKFFDAFLEKAETVYKDDPRLAHIKDLVVGNLEQARKVYAIIKTAISFRLYLLRALLNLQPSLNQKNIAAAYQKLLKIKRKEPESESDLLSNTELLFSAAKIYFYLETGQVDKALSEGSELVMRFISTDMEDELRAKIQKLDEALEQLREVVDHSDPQDPTSWKAIGDSIVQVLKLIFGEESLVSFIKDNMQKIKDAISSAPTMPPEGDPSTSDIEEQKLSEGNEYLDPHIDEKTNSLSVESFEEFLIIFDQTKEGEISDYYDSIYKTAADISIFIQSAGQFLNLEDVAVDILPNIEKVRTSFEEIRKKLEIKGGSVISSDAVSIIDNHELLSDEEKAKLKKTLEQESPEETLSIAKKFVAADHNSYFVGFLSSFIHRANKVRLASGKKKDFELTPANLDNALSRFGIDADFLSDPKFSQYFSVRKKMTEIDDFVKARKTLPSISALLSELETIYAYKDYVDGWPQYVLKASGFSKQSLDQESHRQMINTFFKEPMPDEAILSFILLFSYFKNEKLFEIDSSQDFFDQARVILTDMGMKDVDTATAKVDLAIADPRSRRQFLDAFSNIEKSKRKQFFNYFKDNLSAIATAFGREDLAQPDEPVGESLRNRKIAATLIEVVKKELRGNNG